MIPIVIICIMGYLLIVGITAVLIDDVGPALIWPITGPLFLGFLVGEWIKDKLA